MYRTERAEDFRPAENLVREAFWDLYKPGCDEHLVVHRLRSSPLFLRDLALVAEEMLPSGDVSGKRIVGAGYCSIALIADGDRVHEELYVGPLAVLPGHQGKGIGGSLLTRMLEGAKTLGFSGAFLYGNPDYYRRFGFVAAASFDVHPSEGGDIPQFMGCVLDGSRLSRVRGLCREDGAFRVDSRDVEQFDRGFPPKEKHALPGQLWFGTES